MTGQELYERYAQLHLELNNCEMYGWNHIDAEDRKVWNALAAVVATQVENEQRIAAAPELLAALSELRIAASANPKHQSVKAYRARKSAALAAADAALAKAR